MVFSMEEYECLMAKKKSVWKLQEIIQILKLSLAALL